MRGSALPTQLITTIAVIQWGGALTLKIQISTQVAENHTATPCTRGAFFGRTNEPAYPSKNGRNR